MNEKLEQLEQRYRELQAKVADPNAYHCARKPPPPPPPPRPASAKPERPHELTYEECRLRFYRWLVQHGQVTDWPQDGTSQPGANA